MGSNSALDRVMDQASQAADNFQAPAPLEAQGNALAAQTGPGQLAKPSMAAFAESGGITVDTYLRMDKAGFQASEMKKYFDEMTVEIDMSEVIPIYSSRGEAGGKTTFLKSYDGVVEARTGGNFQQAVAHQQATTKSTGIYPTVEIPAELLEAVTDGETTLDVGTTVGIVPSVTAFSEFQKFVKSLTKQGLQDAVLKVKVKHRMRTNTNNNKWGVADFELIEKLRD